MRKLGRAGTYTVPEGYEPDVALEQQATAPVGTALVRLRHGRGHTLRRHAVSVTELDGRWSEVEVAYWRGSTERDVVALGQHAVAVSPPELVDGVRSALRAVLDAQTVPAGQGGRPDDVPVRTGEHA